VALALAAVVVGNHDFTRTGNYDLLVLRIGHITHGCRKADHATTLRLDAALRSRPRCRAADVEGPHRQLGSGLADRLGRDDAQRLRQRTNQRSTTKVTAIALGAQTVAGFAGQRAAHTDFIDIQCLDGIDRILVERAYRPQTGHVLSIGMNDVVGRDAAEDALTQAAR
jgi:hypothetical protein